MSYVRLDPLIPFKDDKAPAYMKANALGGVVLDVVTLASLSSALRLGKLKLGKTQLIKQEIAAEDRIKLIGFKNKKLDLSISRPKVTQSNKTTSKQSSIKAPSITTVATKQKSKSGLSTNQQKQIKIENVYVKKDEALITQSAANDSVLTQQILAGGQKTGSMKNSGGGVSGKIGVPATRSSNPLSPVLEFDAHGNEIVYRTMSVKDYKLMRDTGAVPATTATSTSPLLSYSASGKYDGITVKITTKPGTSAQLQKIGIAENKPAAAQFPTMSTRTGKWMDEHARFKVEGNQMTTQLGQGKALEIFNKNILDFEPIK